MAITFTPQQQEVIDLREKNILVSAAAGSGKTAVLVERIIEMICDEKHPVDIDQLLIVTFTNAAAAEMRERISAGILSRLAMHPESEHIERQSALLHNAQITTIDSFCMFLLRNHFNEIGVDPAFRVMDEGEKKLLEQDVMAQLLEDQFAAKDPDFQYCVEYFCPAGREKVLEEYILSLYRFAESYPWPEEWLEARKFDYGLRQTKRQTKEEAESGEKQGVEEKDAEEKRTGEGNGEKGPVEEGDAEERIKGKGLAEKVREMADADYGRYLVNHLHAMLEGCEKLAKRIKGLCEEPDGPYMYGELADKELEQIEALLRITSLEEYGAKLPAVTFGRLPSKKDDSVSVAKRELAKKLRNELKDICQGLGSRFFTTPLELAASQAACCEMPVATLVNLTLAFRGRMQAKKADRKLVDFSDMEHYALEILLKREWKEETKSYEIHPSQVALEYRQHFKEVLIDEYQDSNLVQEYLLKAVSGEEDGHYNRFMVGDVKQSIYKFRLARPEIFLEKYETYQSGNGECRRIDLAKNFRSRTEVVDTVNAIFSRIMDKDMGGIAYDERAALYPGAVYPENPGCESELLLVEKPKEGMNARQAEGKTIAGEILRLRREFRVTDKETGALRPVEFRDMVILLRTTSGWDEEFKAALEEEGIPVYITSKTGYFAASEVQELLQFLRTLDNPMQDIPFFGVMKSVFGGFSEEEIAKIRSFGKNKSLYESLNDMVVNEEEHLLAGKAARFLERLQHYRELTVYLPIRELLQQIITEHGYLEYVTALPMGSRRRANVEMLLTKASDFEKTSYHGLFHFIRYMEQLEKYDVDYGEAELLDENANVVRIMSIHKSKGLEFPITFVSGLAKRFNMQDTNQSLIVDVDLGIGTDFVDPVRRIRNKTLRRLVLARKMKEDNLSEELRVLYVALTRPKEKLIMTACVENAEEKWEQQQEAESDRLYFHEFMEAGSYLDFLLPVVGKAPVSVRIKDPALSQGEKVTEQVKLAEKRFRLQEAKEYADMEALKRLEGRFSYQYPYASLEKLYTKTTVSELKKEALEEAKEGANALFMEEPVENYVPRFRKGEEEVSSVVRGTAFHKVMELLDFGSIYQGILDNAKILQSAEMLSDADMAGFLQTVRENNTRLQENLREMLIRLRVSGKLPAEYLEVVSERKLLRFLTDPLALRMWRAAEKGKLFREQPFVYGISAERLGEEFPKEETVLIQGIVDAFFVEDNSLVLVDYKTDFVKRGGELWKRYKAQLDYYEEALCRLTALPMKEKILYSFCLEKTVREGE